MKIDKLTLGNFRCFEEKTFEFPSLFTVVIGENGKGKSTILEGLRLAAATFLLGIDEAERLHIQKEDVRRIDIGKRFATQQNCYFEVNGSVWGNSISWKRTLSREGGKTDTKDAKDIITLSQYANHQINIKFENYIKLPVICYFSTARLWAESKQTINLKKKGSKLKDGYARCVDERCDRLSPMEWIKTAYWKTLKGKEESVLLEAVLEAIGTCIPGWQPLDWDEDTDDLAGTYTHEDGSTSYRPLYYLSDGLRTMATMAAEIAYRCVVLNDYLGREAVKESEGIVMIDEIDMHLHPSWQRNVVADLKRAFPKIQFIVTTHSPFIVQSLKAGELINLDKINLEDRLVRDPFHYGIEDITETEMGVSGVERSNAFKERLSIATEYYQLIAEGQNSETSEHLARLKEKLNELEDRFSDDPLFLAQLQLERKINKL